MTSSTLVPAVIAGLLAGIVFLLVAAAGLGFFFMFLPTLPLFYVGLSKNPSIALTGNFIAAALITAIAGAPTGLLFICFLGLPAWYISRQALWSTTIAGGQIRIWFPLGLTMLYITLAACVFIAGIVGFYAFQPENIVQLLAREIHNAFTDLNDDFGDIVNRFATHWSFMVFPITLWLWGLALYAHGWLVNRVLIKNGKAIRPRFTIDVFPMPNWLLTLMAICALASLIGGESMRFLGSAVIVCLLLPYFFLGAALTHAMCRSWPNRRFFLFFVYFTVFAQFWPALIIAGVGLFHHIKHLPGRATSTKS